ncbi:helix-turn-helix transcriptional regulator [Rhizobium hainanense]|uniref:helix-turn-helix transcriptional regulator n=1 Tax=Rhizobium hainanense TaxID=52131 RepID=UPI003CC806ED
MLVQALRLDTAEGKEVRLGWLVALADPHIGAAIQALHQRPEHRWTLKLLAQICGMSRTAFAVRFKEIVGDPPIEYLTRWKMLLAADRLTRTRQSVAKVAFDLGYQSESAFGSAFKRVIGCSPSTYARGHRWSKPA